MVQNRWGTQPTTQQPHKHTCTGVTDETHSPPVPPINAVPIYFDIAQRFRAYESVCYYTKRQVAVHVHGGEFMHDLSKDLEAHMEMLELLGISRERVILVDKDVRSNQVEGYYVGLASESCFRRKCQLLPDNEFPVTGAETIIMPSASPTLTLLNGFRLCVPLVE